MTRMGRAASAVALAIGFSAWSAPVWAEEDTPSVVRYGFDGFWTGAQIGLASGYLATGREFDNDEWRKLVFGAGVGALVGVGVGIGLGVADLGAEAPATGRIILRDTGYGVGLGAVVGTAVGALFLIDGGRPKNLLNGAAVGTVVGAGAGLVFGILESAMTHREPPPANTATVHFTLLGSDQSYLPLPGLQGSF